MKIMELGPVTAIAATFTLITLYGSAAFASETYELVTEWGSYGSEDGQFIEAQGIAVGPEGNIYVSDTLRNCRIQKFTSEGEFITAWGEYGSEDGEFISPWGIDVDTEGNVYVADMLNDRVQKFTSDGEFITAWSTGGKGNWMYSTPFALAVDTEGNVYVHHSVATPPVLYDNFIQKFTSEGIFIKEWPFVWIKANQMATDSRGTLYVPANLFGPVQKFTADGALLEQWNSCSLQEAYCINSGIAIDEEDNVYISDAAHHKIKKFTAGGEHITSWELKATEGFGSAPSPRGLAVDNEGYVYVIDIANSHIQKYAKVTATTTTTPLCLLEKLYGEHSREIELMRSVRDNLLNKTPEGQELIRLYYKWSPLILKTLEKDKTFPCELRTLIDKLCDEDLNL